MHVTFLQSRLLSSYVIEMPRAPELKSNCRIKTHVLSWGLSYVMFPTSIFCEQTVSLWYTFQENGSSFRVRIFCNFFLQNRQNFQLFPIVFSRVKSFYKTSIPPCLLPVPSRSLFLEKVWKSCNLEKHTNPCCRPLKECNFYGKCIGERNFSESKLMGCKNYSYSSTMILEKCKYIGAWNVN